MTAPTSEQVIEWAQGAGFTVRNGVIKAVHSNGSWVELSERLAEFAALAFAAGQDAQGGAAFPQQCTAKGSAANLPFWIADDCMTVRDYRDILEKQGGSMNHTETPWVLYQQDGAKLAYTIFASSQLKAGRIEVAEWDSYVALAGGLNYGNAEANARRIVACVNACEGISTENLEDNLPVKELADRYNALQKHCDGFAEQAAFQRDARLGALKELAKVEGQRGMLLDVLRKTADDLAYVAHCFDGSKLDDLPAGLSESTCPSETALIAERNCREAIRSVKGGAV